MPNEAGRGTNAHRGQRRAPPLPRHGRRTNPEMPSPEPSPLSAESVHFGVDTGGFRFYTGRHVVASGGRNVWRQRGICSAND